MSEKISEYSTSVSALATGDLMDVSKLISTSPDVYQSQKLNYSVLLTELNADLSITLQSAYNASTQPQILTSVAKGGVVIRSGQSLDTNSVLELKNIAGSSTFVVGGNGIVATGNWQATAIAAAFGGTGQTSYTIGDIIYASNTTAISKLGIGTSGQVLTVSGGGIPSWATVSAPNLGSANLTSTDDARTFTLKSGGTATQNLQFLNSAGKKGFYFDGRGKVGLLTSSFDGTYGGETSNINFGDSTNKVAIGIHLDNVSGSQYYAFRMFSGANVLQNVDARGFIQWHNQSNNANIDITFGLSGNAPRIYTNSPSTSLWQVGYGHYYNGTRQVQIATDNSTNGYITVHKSDGSVTNIISGNRPYEATWFGQGLVLGGARYRAATPFFDVMGAGSTSATTTALFQNSASVSALKVKDDGYCILKANNAAIASGDLANNEMSFYIDEGTNHCVVKVKYSSGTVKTGTFNLT